MVSDANAEWRLYWVTLMLSVAYAEFCSFSVCLSSVYAYAKHKLIIYIFIIYLMLEADDILYSKEWCLFSRKQALGGGKKKDLLGYSPFQFC